MEASHPFRDFGGGPGAREVQLGARARPMQHVDVGVGEPGGDGGAAGVEDSRLGAPPRDEVRSASALDDPALRDRQRVGVGDAAPARPQPRTRDDELRGVQSDVSTGFSSTPTPSTSTSMRSPTTTGATPAGVPVAITSPGSRVMMCEM